MNNTTNGPSNNSFHDNEIDTSLDQFHTIQVTLLLMLIGEYIFFQYDDTMLK